jgi:hypothetical protein
MKRKGPRNRRMPFPADPVMPIDQQYSRKIFVIRQASLPATNAGDNKIRRILIFDDHPDSLRLFLGDHSANPNAGAAVPQRGNWQDPVLAWMLMTGALIVMISPLFLRFPS